MPRLLEAPHGAHVRLLTLDNPGKRNAVDDVLLDALVRAIERAEADQVRCLVLTGSGDKAFCAGYDLSELSRAGPADPLPDAVLHLALQAIERSPLPMIAALDGVAYGAGAELAVACDLRIAAAGVRLAMPPAKLGIVYAPAGLQRFVELVGLASAKKLFFTGEPVAADEALRIGLVDELCAADSRTRALELAEQIAQNAPLAVQGMKRLFALMRRRELPRDALAEVDALRRRSFASVDAAEGIAAMRAKRAPRFSGR